MPPSKFGQSICPSLVKLGSSLVTAGIAGQRRLDTETRQAWSPDSVIQTQCPAVMTQIASGDLSALNLKLPGPEPPARASPAWTCRHVARAAGKAGLTQSFSGRRLDPGRAGFTAALMARGVI